MAYTQDIDISLGSSLTGLTLNAQIVNSLGEATGAPITTGFVELGSGCYLLHCTSIPDGHRGAIKIYTAGAPAVVHGIASINAEEAESVTTLLSEVSKVPKSDGTVSWNSTALASINAEVDTALNTAIPGSPTTDSINERLAAIDGHITADYGSTEKAAIDLLDDAAGGLLDIHTDVGTAISDIAALAATITAIKGVGWSTETLKAIDTLLDAIKAKTDLIEAVTTVPLTVSQEDESLSGRNYATFFHRIELLTIPSEWTTGYFTVKRDLGEEDSASYVQVVVSKVAAPTDGLLYLNQEEAADPTDGQLILDSVLGRATITISDQAMGEIPEDNYVWDIKVLIADDSSSVIVVEGTMIVEGTATHEV